MWNNIASGVKCGLKSFFMNCFKKLILSSIKTFNDLLRTSGVILTWYLRLFWFWSSMAMVHKILSATLHWSVQVIIAQFSQTAIPSSSTVTSCLQSGQRIFFAVVFMSVVANLHSKFLAGDSIALVVISKSRSSSVRLIVETSLVFSILLYLYFPK